MLQFHTHLMLYNSYTYLTGCPTKHASHDFCLFSLATNMLESWDLQGVKKNVPPSLLNISATKYQIFKLFFSPENYANFEYKTLSVRY